MIVTIEVPLFWSRTWPGSALSGDDTVVATFDDNGDLIDLVGAPEEMMSEELTALIEATKDSAYAVIA